MDLKELFGKQPNYVQFPPEKAPTLEKFIAERAMIPHDARPAPASDDPNKIPNMFGNLMPDGDSVSSAYSAPKSVVDPVDTETKAVALESEPINEGRLAEIKAMFDMQAPVSQTAQAPQMPERQSSMDIASIKKIIDKDGYKLGFEDMLPALAPLAADLFTGGTGAGLPVAAGYLDKIQKEEASKNATLEKYLMDIERSRAKNRSGSLSRRYQPRNITDPVTGRSIYANYDTATGQFFLPDGTPISDSNIEVGFAVTPDEYDRRLSRSTEAQKERGDYFGRGVRLDPDSGLLVRVENGQVKPIQTSISKLNPKQQKDLRQITNDFKTTDLYKKTVQTLSVADNITDLIAASNNSNNAVAANSARTQLARMSGEVGAMSDSDIERSGGSPSIKESAKRYTNLQKTGAPISKRDAAEIAEVARIYETNARRKLNEAVALLEQDFILNYGGIPGAVQTKMAAIIPAKKPQAVKKKVLTFEEWKKQNGK